MSAVNFIREQMKVTREYTHRLLLSVPDDRWLEIREAGCLICAGRVDTSRWRRTGWDWREFATLIPGTKRFCPLDLWIFMGKGRIRRPIQAKTKHRSGFDRPSKPFSGRFSVRANTGRMKNLKHNVCCLTRFFPRRSIHCGGMFGTKRFTPGKSV